MYDYFTHCICVTIYRVPRHRYSGSPRTAAPL